MSSYTSAPEYKFSKATRTIAFNDFHRSCLSGCQGRKFEHVGCAKRTHTMHSTTSRACHTCRMHFQCQMTTCKPDFPPEWTCTSAIIGLTPNQAPTIILPMYSFGGFSFQAIVGLIGSGNILNTSPLQDTFWIASTLLRECRRRQEPEYIQMVWVWLRRALPLHQFEPQNA